MSKARQPKKKVGTSRRIPIPRAVMADFKRWANGSKSALAQYLRGYRRSFRQRMAAGETPRQIHASVKAYLGRKAGQ